MGDTKMFVSGFEKFVSSYVSTLVLINTIIWNKTQ
jgi:hypothetical protein